MKLTVKEYCEQYKLSKPTVYKMINEEKLNSILEGKRRFILVNEESKSVNQSVSKTVNNEVNLLSQITDDKNDLKAEIEKLKEQLTLKDEENKSLYERLITVEKEQKEEIKKLQEAKDAQLLTFMNLIKEQSQNLLNTTIKKDEFINNKTNDLNDDIIDVTDVHEPKKEYWSLDEFVKIMKPKTGYKKSKIIKLINEKIELNDPRFKLLLDGGVKIEKGSYKDF